MSAEQIVTELCDELGVEPEELVDRVFSYHLVNMAFDACVRQRVAELEAAGRPLTARDVRDALDAGVDSGFVGSRRHEVIADFLNRFARGEGSE